MVYFEKWKVIFILAMCALGFAFAAPNLLSEKTAEALPDWLPKKQISLGLDLQGGSHLLLEVQVETVIRERLEALLDLARTELRKARVNYRFLGVDGHSVAVDVIDQDKVDQAKDLIKNLDPDASIAAAEGGQVRLTLSDKAIRDRAISTVEQSVEIVRRRIDETGVREPTIQRQGHERILVQLPGIGDPDRIKRLLGKTAKMTFHLVDEVNSVADAEAGKIPPGSMLLPYADEKSSGERQRKLLIKKKVMVSGDTLIDAQPSFDQRSNQPIVSFRFDSIGARMFGDATRNNVNKLFAIVLDGKVISAPVIREPILGGSGQISGNFTAQSAKDLALLLRAGALPAPLTIIEERSVGPGLGADSIAAGKIASVIGLLLVAAFMVIAYGGFGVMANAALIVNLVMIIALLSALQATLTLPGIAGVVLTIGMAVDSNVLVFERIREEVRSGRSPISAIDTGYVRAIGTVVDSNLTTLIAALFLYQFGTGPIRGFAVTLAIGIITSMFTAVMLTRLMVVTWLKRTKANEVPL